MTKYIFILSIFFFSCTNNFKLQEGDLLFQDLDSSPICDAIELVTPGYHGSNFSHVGLIVLENDILKVLEAIPPKVILTNLDDFLNRSSDKNKNPKVIVGRLNEKFHHAIPNAIKYAKAQLNEEYDDVFLIDNKKYYCSELIYEAFISDSIFQLNPMTFLNPKTQDTIQIWKEYYSELNTKIPEGEKGINPGIMSLSNKIEIVHIYGIPDGMNN
jgi:hypothetical protein